MQFVRAAQFALASLVLIVFSGAAVRLTQSGLGCPDWPRCYGKPYPPLDSHSMIEFGNRVFSALVSVAVLVAAVFAWRRRPYDKGLFRLALLLPLGAFAQAALGAFTVKSELHFKWVISHFLLSMLMMIAAVALLWRAQSSPTAGDGAELSESQAKTAEPLNDVIVVWVVRSLTVLAALVVVSGTLVTASGPHAGNEPGESIVRFQPKDGQSLEWLVQRHGKLAELFGGLALLGFGLTFLRASSKRLRFWIGAICVLAGLQGLVGLYQWHNQLPSDVVWLHVALATLTWTVSLWAVAVAGKASKNLTQ